MSTEGFQGERNAVLAEASLVSDHAHCLRLVRYRFPDGSMAVYLEVEETGVGYAGQRVIALSTAIHALLNLGKTEIFEVENRAVDWEGQSTSAGQISCQ